ncbi:MAG: DUF5131 family protein [Deinococcus sp.]|nr:DUF5131 family protein [Deinococcus sp.]
MQPCFFGLLSENCYAEAMAKRLAGRAGYAAPWKPWTAPNAKYNIRLRPELLLQPLRWRKPQRIFVNSMSDLFHEQVPDEFIADVYATMAQARQHTFLVLTKRLKRALDWYRWFVAQSPTVAGDVYETLFGRTMPWPLPNVWLGVSVEDQRTADERLPILMQVPAAVRFISAEPLLGPLDGCPWTTTWIRCQHGNFAPEPDSPCQPCGCWPDRAAIDLVIIGGESGPHFREMDMAWARDLIAQCQAAGVSCFVKQDSGLRPGMQGQFGDAEWALKQLPEARHDFPQAAPSRGPGLPAGGH